MNKPSNRPRVGERSGEDGRNTPRAYNAGRARVTGRRWFMRQCSNNEAKPTRTESNSRLSSPAKEAAKPAKIERLKAVWPEVWKLMRPRRALLTLGFVLMVINKIAGFVLPYSSKYLMDNVVNKNQTALLRPLVLSVLLATLVQGVTSFSLTQLLSKAAQRLIADLRPRTGAHLPPARSVLRRQQSRRSGVPHHERCGRRSQSSGNGPGGLRWGSGRGQHRAGLADSHQCTAHADCGRLSRMLRVRLE